MLIGFNNHKILSLSLSLSLSVYLLLENSTACLCCWSFLLLLLLMFWWECEMRYMIKEMRKIDRKKEEAECVVKWKKRRGCLTRWAWVCHIIKWENFVSHKFLWPLRSLCAVGFPTFLQKIVLCCLPLLFHVSTSISTLPIFIFYFTFKRFSLRPKL